MSVAPSVQSSEIRTFLSEATSDRLSHLGNAEIAPGFGAAADKNVRAPGESVKSLVGPADAMQALSV